MGFHGFNQLGNILPLDELRHIDQGDYMRRVGLATLLLDFIVDVSEGEVLDNAFHWV